MSKKTAAPAPAAAPAAAPPLEIPTISPPAMAGMFQPNILNMPTHEQLVAIVYLFGHTTRHFHGQDQAGNLVDTNQNVIIPAALRPFFQNIPVQPQ